MSEAVAASPFMPFYNPADVTFVRGSGTDLWDTSGKRYLDFLGGLAVVALGHSHPAVSAAIAQQASTLMHVSNLFANGRAPAAAAQLASLLQEATGREGQLFFTNSGAEANELALKLARKFGGRGRHVVISAYASFHGRTLATLAATGQPAKHEAFQPMPDGFRYVSFNDVGALATALDPTVAAVLLETVQGEGGVVPADVGYLRAVRELCDERGALLIIDEIQTGFGRTGEWFGFQHAAIAPDIVTMAKAMGNGFPVGAAWARREVASVLAPGDHGSTYGGNALAAAVVSAVIDELRRIDAPALAAARGYELAAKLAAVPGVASVRGRGLLVGVELSAGAAKAVCAELLAAGLVTNAVTDTALRLAPPLTVGSAEIDEAVAIMTAVMRARS